MNPPPERGPDPKARGHIPDPDRRKRADSSLHDLLDHEKAQKERPFGYLVREAPADDIRQLQQLAGHLEASAFITKFRKIFMRNEMNDDLVLVPARLGQRDDDSEYEELLPVSPP